jgi:hypothetical protein
MRIGWVPCLVMVCWAWAPMAQNARALDSNPEIPWNLPGYKYRTLIRVGAGGYDRHNRPVEVEIDFSKLAGDLGLSDYIDPVEWAVLEHREEGVTSVPFQFDKASDFHPWTDARGTLTFIMTGLTPFGGERRFYVYFGLQGYNARPETANAKGLVRVDLVAEHQGQASFQVQSPVATYYYHKLGAGFATLLDTDGADWLGYNPGVGARSDSGSGGKYRGTPNMGHPEGYCHPGEAVSDSCIVSSGPVKVTIESESNDGKMHCQWDIFPGYARMTVLNMREPYWYLYEGTPGGELDMDSDFCVRPAGDGFAKTPVSERWNGDIPASDGMEWVCFADPKQERSLYIVHHEDDEEMDSYWPMNEEMTVFGFGRLDLKKFMRTVPSRFTIGLCDGTEPARVKAVIDDACQPLAITVGPIETRR